MAPESTERPKLGDSSPSSPDPQSPPPPYLEEAVIYRCPVRGCSWSFMAAYQIEEADVAYEKHWYKAHGELPGQLSISDAT